MEDICIEFEHWLRRTMPKQLCLSDSKGAAINSVFYHFSDYIRPLERKAPQEFKWFFDELKKEVKRAGTKRKPFGHFLHDRTYKELPKVELELLKEERKKRRRKK